jgi:hypothetical protein
VKRSLFIALLVAMGALVLAPASWASGDSAHATKSKPGTVGIRLVPLSGSSSSNPLASSYIVARLAPGARLTRTVEIDNATNKVAHVAVYVAAANIIHGKFIFSSGHRANSLTGWTSVSDHELALTPHSQAFDVVRVRVPISAPSGAQFAVVWASVSASPRSGVGITLVSRVVVRMYVTVGPGGSAPPSFTMTSLAAARSTSGDALVVSEIHNTGAITLDLTGVLLLTHGPGGLSAGPFAATMGSLLSPASSEPLTVQLSPNFPRGPWHATLRVSSGTFTRSRSATLNFPSRYATSSATSRGGVALWLVAGALLLLALAVVALVFSRTLPRRRRPPS